MSEVQLEYALDPDFINRHGGERKITVRLDLYPDDSLAAKQTKKNNCDLLLLLDNSGSMRQSFSANHPNLNKLAGIKQAALGLLPLLDAKDTMTLISYNSNAIVKLSQARGNEQQTIEQAINAIPETDGGTNFEDALEKASRCIASCQNPMKRIVFLTDGMNYGGDLNRAMTLNKQLGEQGVIIDCMGVGEEFDLDFLHKLAANGGGQSAYLETPAEAVGTFQQTFTKARTTLVSNARLQLDFSTDAHEIDVYALYPQVHYFTPGGQRQRDGSMRFSLPPFAIDSSSTFIFQSKVVLDQLGTSPTQSLCTVQLRYDIPSQQLSGQQHVVEIPIHLTDGRTAEARDTDVERDYSEAHLMKLNLDLNEVIHQKRWEEAINLLRTMVQTAKKLGLADKYNEYEEKIELLKRQGCLTQEDCNKIYKQSSSSNMTRSGRKTDDSSMNDLGV